MKYKSNTNDINSNFLDQLLLHRGIVELNEFKRPNKSCTLNGQLLCNMDKAIELVNKYIDKKISLIIDCDCDGFTSSAILYQYLRDVNPNVNIEYHIHSGKQHGLEDIMERLDNSIDLLIIPDASSNDYEFHKELSDRGIPVLVLDHHDAEHLSEFALVVNNQLSEEYKNKDLSGAGIVYKFCEQYDEKYGYKFAENYLDLAAIGIIGDMMNLTHLDTRYIINKGLKSINNIFIDSLIEKQSYSIGNNGLTPTTIAFYIVPLINALIRVGKDSEKEIMFKAFVEGDKMVQSTKRGAKPGQFESIAEQAARTCVNARSRQNRTKEKMMDVVDMEIEKNGLNDNCVLVLDLSGYDVDANLTGLIAMQTVAKYRKPVLLGRQVEVIVGYQDKEEEKPIFKTFLRGSIRGLDKSGISDLKSFLVGSKLFEFVEGRSTGL